VLVELVEQTIQEMLEATQYFLALLQQAVAVEAETQERHRQVVVQAAVEIPL
jgi:hypothetical protein